MSDQRRQAVFWISLNDFHELVRGMDGRSAFRLEGLPVEWEALAATFDFERNAFGIRVRGESFATLKDAEPLPEIAVTIRRDTSEAAVWRRIAADLQEESEAGEAFRKGALATRERCAALVEGWDAGSSGVRYYRALAVALRELEV